MEHAILAPTAFNIQNWRFVRVTDPEQRKAIRAVAWDQAQVTDASELLVLCFDNKCWQRDPQRYWRKAPQEVQDFLVPAIDDYFRPVPISAHGQLCAIYFNHRVVGPSSATKR
jgi:nitroreductase